MTNLLSRIALAGALLAAMAAPHHARAGLLEHLFGTPSGGGSTTATPPDAKQLSPTEQQLAALVDRYRIAHGLPAVPISKSLTAVARDHVIDLVDNHPDNGRDARGYPCTIHSWSSHGSWQPMCYTADAHYAEAMWNKPREITGGVYRGDGFEIAVIANYTMTPADALDLWESSPAHNAVLLEQGTFEGARWKAMGVGAYEGYAVVWFGLQADPAG